jgi:hypothetical protein
VLIFGVACAGASIRLGFLSRRDQDLDAAHPTLIRETSEGQLELSFDPRTAPTLDAIETTAALLKSRRPLPEPDGLVDEQGTGRDDEQAVAVAVARVEQINHTALEQERMIEDEIAKRQADQDVSQGERPALDAE